MKTLLSREKQEKGAINRPLGSKAVKSSRKNFVRVPYLLPLIEFS